MDAPLKPFWLSWWQDRDVAFTLHSPWWRSGFKILADGDEQPSIVAAVMARDEADAVAIIAKAHDRPVVLDYRFVNERAADWSPFCDRFARADWMQWEGS